MTIPEKLPILPVPNIVLLPGGDIPLKVIDPRHLMMIVDVVNTYKMMVLALIKNPWMDKSRSKPEIKRIGTVAAVTASQQLVDGSFTLFLHGLTRVRIGEDLQFSPYQISEITEIQDGERDREKEAFESLGSESIRLFHQAVTQQVLEPFPEGTLSRLPNTTPANFLGMAAALLSFSPEDKQDLLECDDMIERAEALISKFQSILLSRATLGDTDTDEGEGGFTH